MNYLKWFCMSMVIVSCVENDDTMPSNYKLEYPAYYPQKIDIPDDNQMNEQKIELGRMLFYEKMLSKDSSVSCASCHQQKFAFSDPKQFSEGVNQTLGTRNTMAIVNMVFENKFFWDGRSNSLEEQALGPIENPLEMNLSLDEAILRLKNSSLYQTEFKKCFGENAITKENLAKAISQFERTLISDQAPYDLYKQGKGNLTKQEKRGEKLFFTHPDPVYATRGGNCGDCHSGPLTTSRLFANNGLENPIIDIGLEEVTKNQNDKGRFKITTLRNIELTAPYMHDGRFQTLEEVLDHYNEHIQDSPTLDVQISNASNERDGKTLALTEEEKQDILAFLKTLTDKNFIENPKFSNPF